MKGDTKQIGVQVDEDLKEDFRSVVKHRYDGVRGPLGDAYETAMKLYISVYLLTEPSEYTNLINSAETDSAEFEKRLSKYMDSVGDQLIDVQRSIQEHEQSPPTSPHSARGQSQFTQDTSSDAWDRTKAQLPLEASENKESYNPKASNQSGDEMKRKLLNEIENLIDEGEIDINEMAENVE